MDGYSRLAYTEVLSDERAITAIGFVHRARAWFAVRGIHHIDRIVSDNGSCYLANDLAKVLRGARHQRITPYTTRHNGKVERYNRILAEEFLYARTWTSEQQRTDALKVWNIHFNYHRPHGAVGGHPPAPGLTNGVTKVIGLIQLAGHTHGAEMGEMCSNSRARRRPDCVSHSACHD